MFGNKIGSAQLEEQRPGDRPFERRTLRTASLQKGSRRDARDASLVPLFDRTVPRASRLLHAIASSYDDGYTEKEVTDVCREVTGHEIPTEMQPQRAGDCAALVANSTKARTVLGRNPQHADQKEIIQSAWDWHRAHPNGYEDEEELFVVPPSGGF